MKTYYKNIYSVLKLNRLIIFTVIICSLFTSGFAIYTVSTTHRKALNSAFVISTDGSIIPLQYEEQRENFKVEALAHLELFHTYFYNLEAASYKHNLEKALWLGNRSVDDLYKQKKADGIYNRLMQYGLVQKVLRIDSKIKEKDGKHLFETVTVFEINRGSKVDTYQLVSTGNLIPVNRNFPHNPHGLLITNYYESSLRKLKD